MSSFKDGEPCDHPGCLNHQSHPCEGCGRIGGRYPYWVVEQFVRGTFDVRKNEYLRGHLSFEFQGLFDSEEKAVQACRNENYYIFPVILNESLPHETLDMPGGYYPLLSKEKKE